MTSTTLTFPTPSSLGSLDHYIQAVNRFPLLTQEQETALGRALKETDDVDAALKKGDLKFTLDGFKLKGSWVLVRTRGYARRSERDRSMGPDPRPSDGRSWLLIKHRDDWSGDLDIAEFAPLSVKSELDFHEILAEDTPAIWRTNRPVEGGETGAMLRDIIEKAAALKAAKAAAPKAQRSRVKPPARRKKR